ncbi:MAG TPA: universal stress protein [Kofleriaceae bacterium]|nr:universal stress protein [Kofleriaceae bacterium]
MKFSKLLCPVDFSPGSQQAIRLAVRLANEAEAELVLAHVWYLPSMAYAEGPPFPVDTTRLMSEDEERGLAAAALEATRLGAHRVTTRFLRGVPWDQIVEILRDDAELGLVVMGTHGRTGFERILLGSVTEKVLRHAPCPVLAVPVGSPLSEFRRVLCPIDFSESSRRAVALAAELVARGGEGITLFHVIELPSTYSGSPPLEGFREDFDRTSMRMLEDWARALRTRVSVPVTIRSKIGSPGARTLAFLDEDPTFDLVVMGSHGRTGLKRMLLGSVAEKVVRHARCPVLVARDRG